MRAHWVSGCLVMAVTVGACSGEGAQLGTAQSNGGGDHGGTTGGDAAGRSGGTSISGGNNGGGGGTDLTGGPGGVVGVSGGASAGDAAGAAGAAGDAGGASDAGGATGGAPSDGGAGPSSAAGRSAGGDGAGGSPADCSVVTTDKLIFVSSALYTGNIGGLGGADSKCQALANTAGLCGTYKAWLSDGTGDAAARLTHATGNYLLTNGQVLASGWSGLTSGALLHAIDQTEKKTAAPVGTVTCGGIPLAPVWTGATFSGIAVANGSCANWGSISTGVGAAFGNANSTNSGWSGTCQLVSVCPSTAALYCVQQ